MTNDATSRPGGRSRACCAARDRHQLDLLRRPIRRGQRRRCALARQAAQEATALPRAQVCAALRPGADGCRVPRRRRGQSVVTKAVTTLDVAALQGCHPGVTTPERPVTAKPRQLNENGCHCHHPPRLSPTSTGVVTVMVEPSISVDTSAESDLDLPLKLQMRERKGKGIRGG